MARDFQKIDHAGLQAKAVQRSVTKSALVSLGAAGLAASPLMSGVDPALLLGLGAFPALAWGNTSHQYFAKRRLEQERDFESKARGGKRVIGAPPQRDAIAAAIKEAQSRGKLMLDKYLVGFEVDTGAPLWVDDEEICRHACVFAKTGVGKTLWLESLMFQQMLRGRASGCTFIDAKRDSSTLAHIILMAMVTGRIEDLIVIDPFDAVHAYNFVLTNQRADVKARKVLRAGLPPTSDQSVTKHYDRLAADSIYRMVRAMESFGLSWSIKDIAVSLSAFNIAYPHIRSLLHKIGARQAMVELGHLASSYRGPKGQIDAARITDNLRGIASELHAISGSQAGEIFCTQYTDLVLTDAILRGKIIYFMLPRLEEAESAARMVKVFREDLEVSIGEITSSRHHRLEDPHLVIVDEGSSTFGPTWANLFELARKGRFGMLFGAQSIGGLTDASLGLSEAFSQRVLANVNLKVMMSIGDNRTAADMTEWVGKVNTLKRSIGAGVTSSKSNAALRGSLDLEARSMGGQSQSVSMSEDEEDLVSAEELKHEMSAEKGLAWFDMGDGRIIKGKSLWFNAEVPDRWEGREFLLRYARVENDEVGLADWVDEQILMQERKETERLHPDRRDDPPVSGAGTSPLGSSQSGASKALGTASTRDTSAQPNRVAPAPDSGPFKLSLVPRGRIRGFVSAFKKLEPNQEVAGDPKASTNVAQKDSSPKKTPNK